MKIFYTLIAVLIFSGASFAQTIFTSEIHYDDGFNSSADENESIEVYVENPQPSDLTEYTIVLYNGSSSSMNPYNTKTLADYTPNPTANGVYYTYNYTVNGQSIQNGAPDGWAICGPSGLIEFLSYEGTFTAASGCASGVMSTNIGVAENSATVEGTSIQNDGFGNWTTGVAESFGSENAGNLPVQLSRFVVEKKNSNTAHISWTTDSESNSAHFEIQESRNGVDFHTIALIEAQGFSTHKTDYSYEKRDLSRGTYYYRLMQVDLDESSRIFHAKSLEVDAEGITIYPTSVESVLNVSGAPSNTSFSIYNALGQLVMQNRLGQTTIDVSNLVAGSYFIKIEDQSLPFFK